MGSPNDPQQSEQHPQPSNFGIESLGPAAKARLGLQLSPAQIENFRWYAGELQDWNERFNLTAIIDPQGITIKHFLDSLTCLSPMGRRPKGAVIDVGTGAGFPGLPLKIAYPALRLTLVEANQKKLAFCRHVITGLKLEGVELLHARAEDVGRDPNHRAQYDWALARAVARLPTLVEYLLPLLKVGGHVLAQKGDTAPAEAHDSTEALRVLGGKLLQLQPVELPGVAETRFLVLLKKVAATPEDYPRRAGMPAKRPIGVRD